jgi:hypothetical protein
MSATLVLPTEAGRAVTGATVVVDSGGRFGVTVLSSALLQRGGEANGQSERSDPRAQPGHLPLQQQLDLPVCAVV